MAPSSKHKDPLAADNQEKGLCGGLFLATLSTNNLAKYKDFYVDALKMTLEGPFTIEAAKKSTLSQLWSIPEHLNWELYHLYRKEVDGLVQLRLLVFKEDIPSIHESYSSRELGPFSLGFPNGDQHQLDKELHAKGFQSMAPLQIGTVERPDGTSYRYIETIYQAPDFLHAVGIERMDGMPPLSAIDPATKKGGPGYSAMVLKDSDVFIDFLMKVLDLELRADRVWESSEGSALGIEAGVPFRFALVYAKGVSQNHLLFLDYKDGEFIDPGVAPRVPNRGLGMWTFKSTNIDEVYRRAKDWGATIVQSPQEISDPILGKIKVMSLLAPNGFLIEIFQDNMEHPGIQLFKEILIGDLDNRQQIEEEKAKGKQIHPYAKHVTRECTDRVINKPADLPGIFILEESYYTYPGKEMEIKPLLFYIVPHGENSVQLHSMQIPAEISPEAFINANTDWTIDYRDLKESERFRPALYQHNEGDFFTVNHPNDLGNGLKFTLIETLTKDYLQVMELLEKDGQRLTPYTTPLIYRRIK